MQKIITVSQLATVLWQFLYLSLKPNIAQILSSRISWRRRSRISTTLVLVCIHLIFWLGYVEIWRHGNFSLSSIFRGVSIHIVLFLCKVEIDSKLLKLFFEGGVVESKLVASMLHDISSWLFTIQFPRDILLTLWLMQWYVPICIW